MRKKSLLKIFIFMALLAAVGVNVYSRNYTFNTKEIAPDIGGAGGHIEMLVELNEDGSIKEIEILSHNETPEYAAGISEEEFLEQFKNKSADDAFIIGEDVDAITGATISSKAVAKILKTCLERVNKKAEVEPRLFEFKEAGLEPHEARYYKVIDE